MNAMKRRMLAIQAAVLAVCAIIVTMTCPAALAAGRKNLPGGPAGGMGCWRAAMEWRTAAAGPYVVATGRCVARMGRPIATTAGRIAATEEAVAVMKGRAPAMESPIAATEERTRGTGSAVSSSPPAGRRRGPSPGRWTASGSASRTGGPGRSSTPSARPR